MNNKVIKNALERYDELIALKKLYKVVDVKEDRNFQRLFKRYFDLDIDSGVFDYCFFQLLEENKGYQICLEQTTKLFEELKSLNITFSLEQMIKISTSSLYFSDTEVCHFINKDLLEKVHLKYQDFDDFKSKINEVTNIYILFHKAFLEFEKDEAFKAFKIEVENETCEQVDDNIIFELLLRYGDKETIEKIYQNQKEGYMWVAPENNKF